MLSYLKRDWKVGAVMWLLSLPIPVTYHVPRGQVEGIWITIAEHYFSYFVKLLPSVFMPEFIETLPVSALFLLLVTLILVLHVFLCAFLAHVLAGLKVYKRYIKKMGK